MAYNGTILDSKGREINATTSFDAVYNPARPGETLDQTLCRMVQVLDPSLKRYTMAEYFALVDSGQIQNRFYAVYKNDVLQRIYLGYTLIMRKAKNGEQVTFGGVFPLVFPIIFP